MSIIEQLKPEIYNRIAAGEVVDRPASIVKELLENSVDAGSSKIIIDVFKGGIEKIRITDNGRGMDAQDLEMSLLPHATSKIKSLDDIDSISTLGFRGEALTSIASVAKITILSRMETEEYGNYIIVENGKVLEKGARGMPLGTSVIVEKLFKNVPAREKFLRRPKVEEADIVNIIERIILANPSTFFKLNLDNKLYHLSDGADKLNAIFTVYGRDTLSSIANISGTMSNIVLEGFAGLPHFSKHNKTYQTIIINGRYVINKEIATFIQEKYANYLMVRQYPFYVLYINMDFDKIDVNVHPNKLEVKFSDFSTIKSLLNSAFDEFLKQTNNDLKSISSENLLDVFNSNNNGFQKKTDSAVIKTNNNNLKQYGGSNLTIPSDDISIKSTKKPNAYENSSLRENSKIAAILQKLVLAGEKDERERKIKQGSFFDSDQTFNSEKCRVLGKLFNTYILVENISDLYLIDQHAAHEKSIFDKIEKQLKANTLKTQNLLIPYVFEVTLSEKNLLTENLEFLDSIGFSIFDFGNLSFILNRLPVDLVDMNLRDFTSNLLEMLTQNKTIVSQSFIKQKTMLLACKLAVKGEMDLCKEEIFALLNSISGNNQELFCPHGRPIIIKIAKNEVEKWFKRIV